VPSPEERLAGLEEKQGAQDRHCAVVSGQILSELRTIREAVLGNGHKGLRREMDGLSLKVAFLLFIASAAFVGVVGLGSRLVYGWITGGAW